MRSFLILLINVNTADANFHNTECGMTKLLQESSIAKLYVNIKLLELVVITPELEIRTHTKQINCSDKNSIERPF